MERYSKLKAGAGTATIEFTIDEDSGPKKKSQEEQKATGK